MRDPARIERVMLKLAQVWGTAPDLRLGQLVLNLAGKADPFHLEDDRLEAALDRLLDSGGFSSEPGAPTPSPDGDPR